MSAVPARVDAAGQLAAAYARASLSAASLRRYRSAWAAWAAWAGARAGPPVEPADLAAYLADAAAAGVRPSTLRLHAVAVRKGCQVARVADPWTPEVRAVLSGIQREHAGGDHREARPLLAEHLAAGLPRLLRLQHTDLARARAAVGVLFAWHGALRGAELVGLRWRDVELDAHGALLTLRRAKRSQDRSVAVAIPHGLTDATCPVAWWKRLRAQLPDDGPALPELTRWGQLVAPVVAPSERWPWRLARQLARCAGMDAALYSAHSFRAGALSSAHLAGRDALAVQLHARHVSASTTARYLRDPERRTRVTAGLL